MRICEREASPGRIYLVNPNRSQAFGHPCLASISAVPEAVDLAVLVVNRDIVLPVFTECCASGVRSAIIIAEGFAESEHPYARQLQEDLAELSKRADVPFCGPNCNGIINYSDNTWCFSAPVTEDLMHSATTTSIGVVSQSGGGSMNFLTGLRLRNQMPSYVISSGNESSIDASDYISAFLKIDEIQVVLCYLEEVRNPEKFREVMIEALGRGKPCVIVKAGWSKKGKLAALAHTGALAGSREGYSGFFSQLGVIEGRDFDEALDKAGVLGQLPVTRWPEGVRLGVVTEGGGAAALVADRAADQGVELPDFSTEAYRRLRESTPASIGVRNPVDLIGAYVQRQPELIQLYVNELAADPKVDAVLYVAATGELMERAVDRVSFVVQQTRKPVIVSSVMIEPIPAEAASQAQGRGVPLVGGLESSLKALEAAGAYVGFRRRWLAGPDRATRTTPLRVVRDIGFGAGGILGEEETRALLTAYEIPMVQSDEVASESEAIESAKSLGFPVVIKGTKEGVAHKTDLGLVSVDLRNRTELRRAYRAARGRLHALPGARDTERITLQPMIEGVAEIFVGGSNQEAVGPLVAVEVGGVLIELTRNVVVRVAPLTNFDVDEMLSALRHRELLFGFRGKPKADVAELGRIIRAIGDLVSDYRGQVLELDLNPVIVLGEGSGATVVDALITLGDGAQSNRAE